MAPERLQNGSFDPIKAEVYSLGILLLTSVLGRYPFRPKLGVRDPKYNLIKEKRYDEFWA